MTMEEGKIPVAKGWTVWCAAFALAAVTVAVYLPVVQCGFVAYDDPGYVTANAVVRSGLSWSGLVSAFTSTVGGFWQPLTILSHMLDCRLFGLNPTAHHAVNLAFHLVNVLLLFGLLRKMTGSVWRSAFVAALFALHPLNVESVAWVAERKNLLCTFFWLLATWAYVGYARRPSLWRYLTTAFLTLCAMMSKPMAVTLPFALLLLDYWPLRRMSFASFGKLFLEKVPLLALTLVFCLLTLKTQAAVGAIVSGPAYSLIDRLSYAVVNYVLYIDKAIWPADLAVLYPMWTTAVSLRALLICLVLLVFVTVAVLRRCVRFPYLTVGWLWYLGTLLPMVGIVLVGYHSIADRFAYIPLIGIFVMIGWGVADFVEEAPRFRRLAVVLSLLVLVALGWTARVQAGYWRDSTSLFRHAVEVTSGNYVMHENLGREFAAAGNADEAIVQFVQAVRINNLYLPARVNLAMLLFAQGKQVEAFALQSESISLFPHDAQLQCDAGIMLADAGRKGEGAACLMQALWLNPDLAKAHFRLAVLLLDAGKVEDAYPHLVAAVRLMPDSAQALSLLEQVTAAMKKAKP
jgi:tetratricopeptide (TPR) repeat protein